MRAKILSFLAVAAIQTMSGGTAYAETSLDQALEGFDDPTPPASTSIDDALAGFDDSAVTTGEKDTQQKADSAWRLSGATTLSAAWNYAHHAPAPGETDYRGLSRLRGKLSLGIDGRLAKGWRTHLDGYAFYDAAYGINGRDHYTAELLDSLEHEAELGEAFMQGRISHALDLKLGRQIVVWGKSDSLRVTDVINPLDNREPGMVDIEDLRLPLTMARADLYAGPWDITALAIPEIRSDKNPVWGSEFYPYPNPAPAEVMPHNGGSNTQYALAANGLFSGWDLSLYWAQYYDHSPHLALENSTPELQHSQLTMTGFAANMAEGNWLLKSEAAHLSGIEYSGISSIHSRTDIMLGMDYSGFHDTTLSLEVVNRHIADYDASLQKAGVDEEEWQSALRYQADLLNARLHLIALASAFGPRLNEGGFTRLSAAYDLADALTITVGAVSYEGGRKFPFSAIADNDRIFLDLKYSF